jgi:hypothetical protein
MEPVTVTVKDQFSAPVEDVYIGVFLEDGTFVTFVETDGDGNGELLLPADTYYLRLHKVKHSFSGKYRIEVEAGEVNTFNIQSIHLLRSPSTDPLLCAVYWDAAFNPSETTLPVGIHYVDTQVIGNRFVGEDVTLFVRNPGVQLLPRGVYCYASFRDITRKVKIPDLPFCELVDLLVPIVSSIGVVASDVPVGTSVTFPLTVVRTDGLTLPDADDEDGSIAAYVTAVSGDTDICTVSVTDTGLVVNGIAVGSTTITVQSAPAALGRIGNIVTNTVNVEVV